MTTNDFICLYEMTYFGQEIVNRFNLLQERTFPILSVTLLKFNLLKTFYKVNADRVRFESRKSFFTAKAPRTNISEDETIIIIFAGIQLQNFQST